MIIITRPSPHGDELVELCNKVNLSAKHVPLFNIVKGCDLDNLQNRLDQLHQNDIVIITSPQICHIIESQQLKIKFPEFVHYFAVGKHTAELFEILSQKSVLYPKNDENSEGLIAYFDEINLPVTQVNVLILSGNIGRTVIKTSLESLGAKVNYCYCYQRELIHYPLNFFNILVSNNQQKQIIVITSIEHLLQLEKYYSKQQKSQYILVISAQRIAEKAKILGWENIYLSDSANNQNLFKTITSICHNAYINFN